MTCFASGFQRISEEISVNLLCFTMRAQTLIASKVESEARDTRKVLNEGGSVRYGYVTDGMKELTQ